MKRKILCMQAMTLFLAQLIFSQLTLSVPEKFIYIVQHSSFRKIAKNTKLAFLPATSFLLFLLMNLL